jgi:hypothetical protein
MPARTPAEALLSRDHTMVWLNSTLTAVPSPFHDRHEVAKNQALAGLLWRLSKRLPAAFANIGPERPWTNGSIPKAWILCADRSSTEQGKAITEFDASPYPTTISLLRPDPAAVLRHSELLLVWDASWAGWRWWRASFRVHERALGSDLSLRAEAIWLPGSAFRAKRNWPSRLWMASNLLLGAVHSLPDERAVQRKRHCA